MAKFSLRTAAQQAGVSKSTILRAIKSGRLSAEKTEAGGYAIDGSEIARVYPPKPTAVAAQRSTQRSTGQDAPPDAPATVAPETLVALLEVEAKALRAMVEELKQSRDDWKAQAERVTIALAAPARPWWKRMAG